MENLDLAGASTPAPRMCFLVVRLRSAQNAGIALGRAAAISVRGYILLFVLGPLSAKSVLASC